MITPPKTHMAMKNRLFFTRKYIFKWLFFSIVILVFRGVNPTQLYRDYNKPLKGSQVTN